MKRAVVVVKGEVQRVGYRDFVEKIARKLGLVGFVENAKPYDVRIICEGEEDKIKEFLERIKTASKPAEVEDIEVNFEEPKKEFEYFEIKRGEPMEELGERMDVAGKVLFEVRDGVNKTVEGIGDLKNGIGDLKEGQKSIIDLQKDTLGLQKETLDSVNGLGEKVNGLKTEVIDRFGSIGEDMKKILIQFQEDRKENREFMERMIKILSERK